MTRCHTCWNLARYCTCDRRPNRENLPLRVPEPIAETMAAAEAHSVIAEAEKILRESTRG